MSDWTDLGFPSPQSGNYGFDRDVGILRTPFDSPWPRQKQGFKAKRETYKVWFLVNATQLADTEAFFSDAALDWFTMPLINGDAAGVADYTVRATGPCTFTPLGMDWWKAQFTVETQIAPAAPDLSDHGFSTAEETCCLADDIQCCESEATAVDCIETLYSGSFVSDSGFDVGSVVGSVAISGDGLVLALGEAAYSSATGRVRIYDKGETAWTLRGYITAADAATSDYFGTSVALSADGAVLVVGADGWDGEEVDEGGVYTYDWTGAAWVQRGSVLQAPLKWDMRFSDSLFGESVALSAAGGHLVVGHPRMWDTEESLNGLVYVFTRDGDAWTLTETFAPYLPTSSDYFGSGVAISADGTRIVIGNSEYGDGAVDSSGCIYVFDEAESVWSLTYGPVTAPTPVYQSGFGVSVGLAGDVLLVGANGNVPAGIGSIYRTTLTGESLTFSEVAMLPSGQPSGIGYQLAVQEDGCLVMAHTYSAGVFAFIPDA